MKTYDTAVIGSGIGGSLIAALNKNKELIMFEKDNNLGGCASTFNKKGYCFNTGATTLVGYEKNHPLKNIFDKVGFKPNIEKSEIAIRVIQKNKTIDRVKNFDMFIDNLNKVYPHKNNYIFWKKIKQIDEKFWEIKSIYYSKYSFKSTFLTGMFFLELMKSFYLDIFKSAESFINEFLPDISYEYKQFIDSQLLITLQTTSDKLPLISLALGLSYPFHDVYYVNNGMGSIFDELLQDINLHKKEQILKVLKEKNFYKVISNKNEYNVKNLILNTTIFDSGKFFEDTRIINYYNKFEFSDQSAFVVYLKIKSEREFLNHYQIILDEKIPNCISTSFFISFSKKGDKVLSKDGYSVTISTHTKAQFWQNLSKDEYKVLKEFTQEFIVSKLLEYFIDLKKDNIFYKFSATSKTFNRYINRANCGGKVITMKDIFNIASCKTPFKGLYNVGDSVFAGQGWPGLALGVEVLNKELNDE